MMRVPETPPVAPPNPRQHAGGVLVLANDMPLGMLRGALFVGNPTNGPRVRGIGRGTGGGEAVRLLRLYGRPCIQGRRPHVDNRRRGSNSRPHRLLDPSSSRSFASSIISLATAVVAGSLRATSPSLP